MEMEIASSLLLLLWLWMLLLLLLLVLVLVFLVCRRQIDDIYYNTASLHSIFSELQYSASVETAAESKKKKREEGRIFACEN
jgi:membrane-anchored glycerophosphoryl diester phosphodiesterase (GDPDase)